MLLSASDLEKLEGSEHGEQSEIRIRFTVGELRSPFKEHRDKRYTKVDQRTVYYERKIGMSVAKMAIEFGEREVGITLNKSYLRIAKASISQFYSPGHLLVDIVHWKLLDAGYTLLHSAAFEQNESGVVLLGLSNSGKTTTAMDFVTNRGSRYISDDLAVTDGEFVYSCPFSLSPVDPEFADDKKYEYYYRIGSVIPYLDLFLSSPVETIADIIGEESTLHSERVEYVFVLTDEERQRGRMSRETARSRVLSANRFEFTYSANQLLWAAHHLGVIDVKRAIETEEDIVSRLVTDTEVYLLGGEKSRYTGLIAETIG